MKQININKYLLKEKRKGMRGAKEKSQYQQVLLAMEANITSERNESTNFKNIIRFLHETEYDDERDRDQHIKIVENILKKKMEEEIKDHWKHIKDIEAELEFLYVREPDEVEYINQLKNKLDNLYEIIDNYNHETN